MLKRWCSIYWLYVMYALAGMMMILQFLNRGSWSEELMMLSAMAVILPLHVMEEWRVPGGFHYSYNLIFKSPCPNCYPMNQLTDMITNFAGELFFILLLLVYANQGALLAMAAFCYLEAVGHTALSIFMYIKFRKKGKRSLYAPGLCTAYLGFLVNGIFITRYLASTGVGGGDVLSALVILVIMIVGMITIPENCFKSKETPYPFPSARYFEKYE